MPSSAERHGECGAQPGAGVRIGQRGQREDRERDQPARQVVARRCPGRGPQEVVVGDVQADHGKRGPDDAALGAENARARASERALARRGDGTGMDVRAHGEASRDRCRDRHSRARPPTAEWSFPAAVVGLPTPVERPRSARLGARCSSTTARSPATVTRCGSCSRTSACRTRRSSWTPSTAPSTRDELAGLSPTRRVPTLVLDDGRPLAESNAILIYFGERNAVRPGGALRPRADVPVDVLGAVRARAGDRGRCASSRRTRATRSGTRRSATSCTSAA